jgi:hypothetical protein
VQYLFDYDRHFLNTWPSGLVFAMAFYVVDWVRVRFVVEVEFTVQVLDFHFLLWLLDQKMQNFIFVL